MTPASTPTKQEILQQTEDKALQHFDALTEAMLESALGAKFVVAEDEEAPRKGTATKLGKATTCEVCPHCQQPVKKKPVEVWEVFRTKPDTTLQRFLYDQLAGKAKSRAEQEVERTFNVIFPGIATLPGGPLDDVDDVALSPAEERQPDPEDEFGLT